MPRNVRNWWIEATVDGRKSDFAAGPRNKEGGFTAEIFQRADGNVERVMQIDGFAYPDGKLKLVLDIDSPSGVEVVYGSETKPDIIEIVSKR